MGRPRCVGARPSAQRPLIYKVGQTHLPNHITELDPISSCDCDTRTQAHVGQCTALAATHHSMLEHAQTLKQARPASLACWQGSREHRGGVRTYVSARAQRKRSQSPKSPAAKSPGALKAQDIGDACFRVFARDDCRYITSAPRGASFTPWRPIHTPPGMPRPRSLRTSKWRGRGSDERRLRARLRASPARTRPPRF